MQLLALDSVGGGKKMGDLKLVMLLGDPRFAFRVCTGPPCVSGLLVFWL